MRQHVLLVGAVGALADIPPATEVERATFNGAAEDVLNAAYQIDRITATESCPYGQGIQMEIDDSGPTMETYPWCDNLDFDSTACVSLESATTAATMAYNDTAGWTYTDGVKTYQSAKPGDSSTINQAFVNTGGSFYDMNAAQQPVGGVGVEVECEARTQ